MNPPLAIVLAAGKGTRMKSNLPKVLCRANGRPLITYVMDALREAGVEQIIAVIGYGADQVRETLRGDGHVRFAEQLEQRGTGHAVMVCRDQIARHQGPVVVVAGDSPMLQASSVRRLLEEFQQSSAACILGTLHHPAPAGLGRILRDEDRRFVGIVEEKDATPEQKEIDEVNMSTYVFDCQNMLSALDELTDDNRQGEYYITDLPGILLRRGLDVRALPVLKPVEALSVNTVEQLEQVEHQMKRSSEA